MIEKHLTLEFSLPGLAGAQSATVELHYAQSSIVTVSLDENANEACIDALFKVFQTVKGILLAAEGGQTAPVELNSIPVDMTVPTIATADTEQLRGMLGQINDLAELVKGEVASPEPVAPKADEPKVVTDFEVPPAPKKKEPEEDPLAQWYATPMGDKGKMTRRESTSQVEWKSGMEYRGTQEKIIQCGVDDSPNNPHGAVWTLTLANGDVVTTDLFGKELQYEVESEDFHLPPPPLATPFDKLDTIDIPDEIMNTVKGNRVFAWLVEEVPELREAPGRIVRWCLEHTELQAFKGMGESQVQRRVDTVLPTIV